MLKYSFIPLVIIPQLIRSYLSWTVLAQFGFKLHCPSQKHQMDKDSVTIPPKDSLDKTNVTEPSYEVIDGKVQGKLLNERRGSFELNIEFSLCQLSVRLFLWVLRSDCGYFGRTLAILSHLRLVLSDHCLLHGHGGYCLGHGKIPTIMLTLFRSPPRSLPQGSSSQIRVHLSI